MQRHNINKLDGHRSRCSCGFSGSTVEVLIHALLLSTRTLADTVAADPTSSPDMIAQFEATAQKAVDLANRSRA